MSNGVTSCHQQKELGRGPPFAERCWVSRGPLYLRALKGRHRMQRAAAGTAGCLMIKIKLGLHTTPVVYGRFTCVFIFIPPPCASRIHQPAGFADSPWASQPLAMSPRWAIPAEPLFLLVLPKSRGRCSLAGVGPGGRVCPGCRVGAPARPPWPRVCPVLVLSVLCPRSPV